MKKRASGILALLMVLGFTACGAGQTGGDGSAAGSANGGTSQTAKASGSGTAYSVPDTIKFDGAFTMNILGYEYFDTKDDYDYNLLNVYFDLTNDSDGLTNERVAYWNATQKGEELQKNPASNVTYGNMAFGDNSQIQIQPGVTIRGYTEFACSKDTDVITVSVDDGENTPVTFDVDPTWEMPDMRAEDFQFAPVADPNYGGGSELLEGSYEGRYDIKVNDITGYSTDTSFDKNGEQKEYKIVGISYTYTNRGDKETSPFMGCLTDNYVFQDGATLVTCSAGKEVEGYAGQDEPLYQDVKPGESTDFVVYYKLRSDSPIEVMFKQFIGGTVMVDKVFEVQ